uniref:5'-nucleotidase n=1 Tax=Acrobeloides nanus TaxID=290746 RepID=A0A914CTC2_9BILA
MDNFLILHNVKTKNIGLVKNKIESLKNLGPGKLICICDFDQTLTEDVLKDGTKGVSTFEVFRNAAISADKEVAKQVFFI